MTAPQRDLDPRRNTVPDASTYNVMTTDLRTGEMKIRPARQADLKHCASCTCPIASDNGTSPASTPEEA